ncbi:glycosyl-4,4'-diaponeurosporenoate acyltransferase CrtO family protein [Pedobacter cryophilus]|uniref:Glycosyl-4,4'-diaponeurosporenoate acyltransferase n=1 Tax=Pedobacter cryophilus TaxID=2571271 RepID=A0A4U1C4I4_9SPHI|nr:hypothetical protein [Pedobacter cryophilus]TKC00760.1 hypothetical protein FA046_03535 [Pedobacter cryophilus]
MRKFLITSLIISVTVAIIYWLVNQFGLQGFLFAWMLNFVLMMCVFAYTQTLKPKFDSTYYDEKSWENKGKIYESLGINVFRKLLVLVGWEKLNKKANPVEKNSKALIHLEYSTKQSEFGHLIIFFIVIIFNIMVAFKFGFGESVWLLVLNILLNLYPIFLQRYNRPRLKKAIRLIEIREKAV